MLKNGADVPVQITSPKTDPAPPSPDDPDSRPGLARRIAPRPPATRAFFTHACAVLGGAALLACFLWLSATARPAAVSTAPNFVALPPTAFAWSAQTEPSFALPPFAQHLAGVRIVLDPGHGGRADRPNWKRGPTGLREAEINLRAALFLRDLLTAAGADVHLTRDDDRYLHEDDQRDLAARVALANDLRADLFLSIHHNAAARPEANYTAVFYHDTGERLPASRTAARYLLEGLQEELRLEQHLPCGVLSDRRLTKNGLAVLRQAEVPAVLTEASFFTNPQEEQRLRDPLYNRREAYGLFLGLARWAQAGLPRVALASPADGHVKPGGDLVISLNDGLAGRGGWGGDTLRILAPSLRVELNARPLPFSFDPQNRRLTAKLPGDLPSGPHTLWIDFENVFGQHVIHPELRMQN